MPLQPPNLDDRTYDQLKRQAQLRIPRYTPQWTDFNESDPGMALVDLFAWLTETMLYRLNQVPNRNYIKFLQILGLELQPPQPACADLVFVPREGANVQPVPQGTQVAAQSDTGEPLIFETTTGLDLIRLPLASLQVFDGAAFTDVTKTNATPGTGYWPFGWLPQVGNALYLGFGPVNPTSPPQSPIFPQAMRFRAFLPLADQAGQPVACPGGALTPAPPATLVWEYRKKGAQRRWQLRNTHDESLALTREGYIQVEGPPSDDIEPTTEGVVADKLYWLRVRIASGGYAAGVVPRLDSLAPNIVQAQNLVTIKGEAVGASDASPNQTFTLRHSPVVSGSLKLTVQEAGAETADVWTERPDFLASGPDDPHYMLDAPTGQIHFGDGRRGRIPSARALITAQEYRYGGGQAGNVRPKTITAIQTTLDGVDSVSNPRPAVGGRDEQAMDDFLQQAPARLRCADRAVSAEDFTALARQVGGIARATALPLFHPDHRGVDVPGAITVVVVPDSLDIPPAPSQEQLDVVCDRLNQGRLLTTELYVKGPEYYEIRVEARVAADPYAAFGTVEQKVKEAINAYLDPLAGASRLKAKPSPGPADSSATAKVSAPDMPRGSDFGQHLFPTHLFGVILNVPEVRDVDYLAITVNGQPWDMQERVTIPPDGMLYGAPDHDISVEPYQNL